MTKTLPACHLSRITALRLTAALQAHVSNGRFLTVMGFTRTACGLHPHVLIIDGTLHNMIPTLRETILRRLCSKDEPWSVVFVSNDPNLTPHVDRRIIID